MAIKYAKASEWVLRLDTKLADDVEPNWLPVLRGFQQLGEARGDDTSEYYYLSGFGAAETGIDSTSRTFTITGHRVYGDPLMDWLFSFERQWDTSNRYCNYQYYNIVTGEGEQGSVSISFASTATGSAEERAAFSVTIAVQGKPAQITVSTGPFTVTYNNNNDDVTGQVIDDEEYNAGELAVVKSASELSGAVFKSWNTRPDGNGISYLPGDTTTGLVDDLNLYGIWE